MQKVPDFVGCATVYVVSWGATMCNNEVSSLPAWNGTVLLTCTPE